MKPEPVGAREYSRWNGGIGGLTNVHPSLYFSPLLVEFSSGIYPVIDHTGMFNTYLDLDVLGTCSELSKRRGHVIVTATRVIILEEIHY